MKFQVTLLETHTYRVIVEAASEEEAQEKALDMEYDEMDDLGGSVEADIEEMSDEA